MTNDQISAMQPGRELDNLIAEKVMGLTGYDFDDTHWYCSTCKAWVHPAQVTFHEVHERCQTPVVADWCDEEGNLLLNYSTDISAAWEVVDKLKIAVIPQSVSAPNDMKYLARIEEDFGQEEIQVFAFTAPEAICKAALLAVIEELPKGIGTTEDAQAKPEAAGLGLGGEQNNE